MATFSWNDNAIYEVRKEEGEWVASGVLAKYLDSPAREHLLRAAIDTLKHLGWHWIETAPAKCPISGGG